MHAQMLAADLVERVESCFQPVAPASLRRFAELKAADERLFCDRILRCGVSATFLEPRYSIGPRITEARNDDRDLVMGTEYDRNENRAHNLNLPFHDAPFAQRVTAHREENRFATPRAPFIQEAHGRI